MTLLERELTGYKKSDNEATPPFFSSLTGKIEEHSIISRPEYWVQNLTSPVLFFAAVENLLNTKGSGMLLEIGPHSTLAGPLREICAHVSEKYCYTSSLVRGEDSFKNMISVFGRLHVEGISMDLTSLYPNAKVVKDLLTYPWDHSNSFWSEGRASRLWRQRKFPHHCLLGSRIPESPDNAPQWRNVLSLENELWIADHEVARSVVLPFSGYIAMAGEAVRQLTGIETGYSIRHAVAHAALVLPELSSIEVITSLRPHRLTDFVDSEWFCFTISTYNSGSWTRNCEGQVKPICHTTSMSRQPQNYPRKVTSSTLYEYIADLGITFGREFQRLQRITSSTEEPIASAQITPVTNEQRRPFLLHPVEIDACFQLLIVAQAKGLRRGMKSLSIPTVIEKLDIFAAGEGEQHAVAWGPSGTISNGVQCYCNGKLILSLSELRLSPLDASDLAGGDIHAAARLEWLPDMNFLDPVLLITPPKSDRRLYRLMEDMGHLCIVDTHEQIQSLEHLQPHFEKLRRWMMKVLQGRIHRSNALVSKLTAYRDLTRDEREKLILSRYKSLLDTSMHNVATAMKRMWENYERIFLGEAQAIDILMQDDVLSALYRAISFDYGHYVRMMAVIKPTLRVLEIGAGTGGTTEHILQHKTHQGGLPQFSKYTFTDVSAGFFAQAKERFENVPNMAYEVLDITSDPTLQGFERSSYDLIIAANVIHATPSLHRSLQHLNKLLKPGGTLLLMEACTESLDFGYVFGCFPGWWVGEADGRIDQPYVPPSRWNEELLASGFTGAATVIYDEEVPYVRSVTIISQSASTVAIRSMVLLVVSDYEDSIVLELFEVLKRDGFTVTMQRLGNEIPANHDVIVLVDLKGPFFDKVSEESFTDFQKFVKHLDNRQKILWVTAPTQLKCKNPRFAQAIGVARALRAELNLRFHTLEIDENEAAYTGLILKVFRKICQEQDDEGLISDKEFAVDAGTICISRFQPFSLQDELSANSIAQKRTAKTLRIGEFGMIDSLYWIEEALPESLAPNEVEFEPKFIGLNLRDVLIAMGIIKSGGTVPFGVGFECSAIITAIGTGVKDLAIGDHIIAVAPDGLIATKKTLAENLIFRAPKQLSLQEAAAVPLVFLTAWYCLLNLGRLDKGKSVLIHSACGGVGLAAIQICKLVGAHIYATVGTEDKVTLLMDKFKIPRNRIFNSRNDSFLEGVMRETNNRGVDVVLNSLSGNLLHVSWDCVAKFGTMVEIGMRDLFDSGQLSLRRFDGSRQYSAFNGDLFGRERPDEMASMAKEFLPLFDVRTLEPLPYMTCFDAQHIVDAFRYLQSGKHVGKVLVSVPDDQAKIAATPSKKSIVFDPNATYLLTGGLGGLGKPIATWMIENGARSLTFLSRSAGTSERSRAAIQEFESMGCRVTAISGAVENMNDIKAAIDNSPTPIKGVLHLAMVLRDATMLNMTWQQWTEVVRTKVLGAWNLHYALAGQSIEFLWLASSMNTVADLPGQGNYGASNAFLEAFCQYRLSLGLPTAVLSICLIKHIGYVAENMPTIHKATPHLAYALGENELLDFVELSLLAAKTDREAGNTLPEIASIPLRPWKNTSQIFMGLRSKLRLGDPRNTVTWRLDRRMGFYHNLQDCDNVDKVGDNSELRYFLKRATEDTTILAEGQNIEFLARTIGQRVLELTLKQGTNVDTTLTLAQMGVDSLMATELRRWFRQALGLQVNILELMKPLTLLDLAEVVSEQLQAKFAPATETAVQP
jgi:NADPH:quinone reductase-like Zn-dependent oxidoreductase/SAM-dependent methyltransferase/NAD(P)-dependent dehydrogenase (short-subunit alcohol dehydrogenase family)/aryl carrier-like protein